MNQEEIYAAARAILKDLRNWSVCRLTVGEMIFLTSRCRDCDGVNSPVGAFSEYDLKRLRAIRDRLVNS